MRLHELVEAQYETPAARSIEKLATKNGYRKLGAGWDSTVWVKGGSNEVIKILMPFGKHKYAKNAFMAFYNYCQRNKGNPCLPRFTEPKTFPVGSVPFMFVGMERLESINRFEEGLVEMLGDYAGNREVWEGIKRDVKLYYNDDGVDPTKSELQRISLFYNTLYDMAWAPEGRGFVWDMHGGNAMRRGNMFVVIDPWVYDTRKRGVKGW